MVAGDSPLDPERTLEALVRDGLKSVVRQQNPSPAIQLALRDTDRDSGEWDRLTTLVRGLSNAENQTYFVGYSLAGLVPSHAWNGCTRVTLLPQTDLDWYFCSATLDEAYDAYTSEGAWPHVILPTQGGWLLESPPASSESLLYPCSRAPISTSEQSGVF